MCGNIAGKQKLFDMTVSVNDINMILHVIFFAPRPHRWVLSTSYKHIASQGRQRPIKINKQGRYDVKRKTNEDGNWCNTFSVESRVQERESFMLSFLILR